MILGFIGLIGSLALMIYLTMRGVNLLIAAPFSAFIAAIFSGISIFPQLAEEGAPDFLSGYMGGFYWFY